MSIEAQAGNVSPYVYEMEKTPVPQTVEELLKLYETDSLAQSSEVDMSTAHFANIPAFDITISTELESNPDAANAKLLAAQEGVANRIKLVKETALQAGFYPDDFVSTVEVKTNQQGGQYQIEVTRFTKDIELSIGDTSWIVKGGSLMITYPTDNAKENWKIAVFDIPDTGEYSTDYVLSHNNKNETIGIPVLFKDGDQVAVIEIASNGTEYVPLQIPLVSATIVASVPINARDIGDIHTVAETIAPQTKITVFENDLTPVPGLGAFVKVMVPNASGLNIFYVAEQFVSRQVVDTAYEPLTLTGPESVVLEAASFTTQPLADTAGRYIQYYSDRYLKSLGLQKIEVPGSTMDQVSTFIFTHALNSMNQRLASQGKAPKGFDEPLEVSPFPLGLAYKDRYTDDPSLVEQITGEIDGITQYTVTATEYEEIRKIFSDRTDIMPDYIVGYVTGSTPIEASIIFYSGDRLIIINKPNIYEGGDLDLLINGPIQLSVVFSDILASGQTSSGVRNQDVQPLFTIFGYTGSSFTAQKLTREVSSA